MQLYVIAEEELNRAHALISLLFNKPPSVVRHHDSGGITRHLEA